MRLIIGLFLAAATLFPSIGGAAQVSGQAGDGAAKRLRLGIIGFHHDHVFGFFRNFLHRTDIEIVGYVEPDKRLAATIAERYKLDPKIIYSTVDELIEKARPQAVSTYTSTLEHRAVVEACAPKGIHVMVEKPLATNLEDALAIQKAAQAGHIQVLVNYETSWYRSNHAAQELVKSGAIGELRKMVVHDGHRGPREIGCSEDFLKWLTDPVTNGAGAMFDFGCYGADLATWLMNGERPVSVTAVALHIKPDIYPKVEDEATIIVKYPKAQAILQASWNWPFDRKDMEVYGRTGEVFTVAANDVKVRLPNQRAQTQKAAPALEKPYDDQITYLRAVVLDGAKVEPLSSIETNVTVVEILDAARRSVEEGKTIDLPAKEDGNKSVSIFDGKTLAGWEGDTKFWRVEDGHIVGGKAGATQPHNDFLATQKSYSNFDLHLQVKLVGTEGFVNTGIQFRSVRVPNNFEMSGYQADAGEGYWGSLYDETRRDAPLQQPLDPAAMKKAFHNQDWNDYRVRADGPHIETWINGVKCVDYVEKLPNIAQDGKIGLQIHGGGKTLVYFKDIMIEELPATPDAPTWEKIGGYHKWKK